MKFRILVFVWASISFGQPCRDFNSSSCWQVTSQIADPVHLSCTSTDPKAYGASFVTQLDGKLKQSDSQQFDMSWGDGLGFPEPATHFTCIATEIRKHKSARIEFSTLSWGDRVKISLENSKMTIQLSDHWGSSTKFFSAALMDS